MLAVLAALAVSSGPLAGRAHAQPAPPAPPRLATTSEILREGNAAALAGDWPRVAALVAPLLDGGTALAPADLGEAHRLAGIAAFFQQRRDAAEHHFVAYLRIDLDGRLDPALYPPEVVGFFHDVASRHAAELRALRARPRRWWALTLVPPLGQLQNGERTKAYVVGGVLGAFLIVNVASYAYLRSLCERTTGPGGGALLCGDGDGDAADRARMLRPINLVSGIGALLTYTYGVYDGVRGYRRRSREQRLQLFFASPGGVAVVGVAGSF